jgi:hypothetical protein
MIIPILGTSCPFNKSTISPALIDLLTRVHVPPPPFMQSTHVDICCVLVTTGLQAPNLPVLWVAILISTLFTISEFIFRPAGCLSSLCYMWLRSLLGEIDTGYFYILGHDIILAYSLQFNICRHLNEW